MSEIRAVLFDLDGTLADTAPDLGLALNLLLEKHGRPPLPMASIRPVASHGARGLIDLGFQVGPADAAFAALRQDFLAFYEANLSRGTILFPGVPSLLAALEAAGLPWGVVTNKPDRYTQPVMAALGLATRAACIVSGDTCSHPKPHPAPLLHAAGLIGVAPANCLYLGDAARDIEAANNAGMQPYIAMYGYIAATDRPETWGAQGMVEQPEALGRLLNLPC